METRQITGFNDVCEFNVLNGKIIISDNGPLYKNKLKNGMSLDELCYMEQTFIDEPDEIIIPLDKTDEIIIPLDEPDVEYFHDCNTVVFGLDDNNNEEKIRNKNRNEKTNENEINSNYRNKKNSKEKNRRNKRKMLKIGNDYKVKQYHDDGIYFPKVINTIVISKNKFKCQEVDNYAPVCDKCYIYAMITKKYFMLYKYSYTAKFCKHVKCWSCAYQYAYIYDRCHYSCNECFNLIWGETVYSKWPSMIYGENMALYCVSYPCDSPEMLHIFQNEYAYGNECTYGHDYGKKYKCGQFSDLNFSYYTHSANNFYSDQNGNKIIQIYDDIFELEMKEEDKVRYYPDADTINMYDDNTTHSDNTRTTFIEFYDYPSDNSFGYDTDDADYF